MARRVPPPYVPALKGASDTSQFDDVSEAEAAANEQSRRFERKLDPKLDAIWEREFGDGA